MLYSGTLVPDFSLGGITVPFGRVWPGGNGGEGAGTTPPTVVTSVTSSRPTIDPSEQAGTWTNLPGSTSISFSKASIEHLGVAFALMVKPGGRSTRRVLM